MTHVVTESCIQCRHTDCVDVCPVDCFETFMPFLLQSCVSLYHGTLKLDINRDSHHD